MPSSSRCVVNTFLYTVGQTLEQTPPAGTPDDWFSYWKTISVVAHFESDETQNIRAHCCSFRQYVKGHMRLKAVDWVNAAPRLYNNQEMSETIAKEDGCNPMGANAYGHRDDLSSCAGYGYVNDEMGPSYYTYDHPGMYDQNPGSELDVSLTFQGKIVDTCNESQVKANGGGVVQFKIIVGGSGTQIPVT